MSLGSGWDAPLIGPLQPPQLWLGSLRQAVLTSWVLKEVAINWRQRSLAAELNQWCYDDFSGLPQCGACRLALDRGWL